jgi:ADP-ribosylglycohydrolase
MLEIAVADAYGHPFEFNTPEFIEKNNDVLGYKHREGEPVTGIGTYTDDTQMSIAVAEQMGSKLPGTQVRFAAHFVTSYKRDPRKGYSRRITNALEESKPNLPFEFILKAKQAGANSNGSVMRAVPLGLISDPKEIMHRSIVQTSTSHGHIDAVNSAVMVSLTAHFFYHLYPRLDEKTMDEKFAVYSEWMKSFMGVIFFDILNSYNLHEINKFNETLKCDAKTTASLSIKLAWGFKIATTMEDVFDTNYSAKKILKKAVDIGGDVDSSASIALGLYSLRPDVVMDIPQALYDNLENGEYGSDFLIDMDIQLQEMFPRNVKEIIKENNTLTDLIS